MREIKFKAWNLDNQKMLIQSEYMSYHVFGITPHGAVYDNGKLQSLILLQYTGLKDKENKEIYDGDIIEFKKMVFGRKKITIKKVVNWLGEDSSDALVGWGYDYNKHLTPAKAKKCIVIGNIYEHPELIKSLFSRRKK